MTPALLLTLALACDRTEVDGTDETCDPADDRWAELEDWVSGDCLFVSQEVEETSVVRGRAVSERLDEFEFSGEVPLTNPRGLTAPPEVEVGRLHGRVYWEFQTGCGVAQGTLTGLVEVSVRIEELDIDVQGQGENVQVYVWEDRTFMTVDLPVPAWSGSVERELSIRVVLEPGQPARVIGWLDGGECILFMTDIDERTETIEYCT